MFINEKIAFSLFDRHGTGRIPKTSIGDLLRACGQNPTLAEITEIESTLPAEGMISCYGFGELYSLAVH